MNIKDVKIKKKNGSHQSFDGQKIVSAISKSAFRVGYEFSEAENQEIVDFVINRVIKADKAEITVEQLHTFVELALDNVNPKVARSYRDYRNWKNGYANDFASLMEFGNSIRFLGDKENANKDSALVATKQALIRGQLGRIMYRRTFLSESEMEANEDGYIYVHDQDFRLDTMNCCLFDIKNVLSGGFEMGNMWYNEPKSLDVAFDVIGDITLSAASQQYGGFTLPQIDSVLAPYAERSYNRALKKYIEKCHMIEDEAAALAWEDTVNEAMQGFQGWEYKFNTVGSSRGDYPFITISFGLARDRFGRTPIILGKRDDGYCATFESFAYLNLGYRDYRELGPGEIAIMTPEGVQTLVKPGDNMKICTFLWVYYGYPSSRYEGVSVEQMRYRCGANMAKRDMARAEKIEMDIAAAVPDSGTAHAVGYANESGIPFSRPFIKYTPTWPRSFMPTIQEKRNMIAKMKLIPVHELIDGQRILLIDDSIVRGTQLRETTEFLYKSGAKEVHVRPACPPIMYGCKYLNFSRSSSEMELIARQVIHEEEGEKVSRTILDDYVNPDSDRYHLMLDRIKERLGFSTLAFNRLDDMLDAVGIEREKLCTYCWDGVQ